jgi:deazaflavin-dependent oxidoreductase (nitroreductase family)
MVELMTLPGRSTIMSPQKDSPEIARQRAESFRQSSGEHLRRYLATDGADGYLSPYGIPALILTTIGRRSVQPYSTPLHFAEHDGQYVLVASNGGSDTHPQWYLNLLAHPEMGVQIRGERFSARPRTARPDERPALWAIMTKLYPRNAAMQASTDREIPVVILERR